MSTTSTEPASGPAPEVLCPFCGAPWSKHAMTKFEDCGSYDTYGHGGREMMVTITCDACNRVMYEKGERNDW